MGMRQRLPLFLLRDVPRRAQRKWALRLQHRIKYCDPVCSALQQRVGMFVRHPPKSAYSVCQQYTQCATVPRRRSRSVGSANAAQTRRGANANLRNPECDMFAHSRELCAQLRQPDARRDDRLEHLCKVSLSNTVAIVDNAAPPSLCGKAKTKPKPSVHHNAIRSQAKPHKQSKAKQTQTHRRAHTNCAIAAAH